MLRLLLNDPAVATSLVGFNPPVSRSQQERWIAGPRGGPDGTWHFTIVEAATGLPVGLTSLDRIDRRSGTAGVGIKVHPDARGRGLAYDASMARNAWAFFAVGLRRLEAQIIDFNATSRRLHERLGFHLEGCRREAVHRNGRWCDLLLYGLLRSEAVDMQEMAPYRDLVLPVSTSKQGAET